MTAMYSLSFHMLKHKCRKKHAQYMYKNVSASIYDRQLIENTLKSIISTAAIAVFEKFLHSSLYPRFTTA